MIEINKTQFELLYLLNDSNFMFDLIDENYQNQINENDLDLDLILFHSQNKLNLKDVFCILDKEFNYFEENIQNVMFQEDNEFEKSQTPSYKEIKYLLKKEIIDVKIIKVQNQNISIDNFNNDMDFELFFNKICEEYNYNLRYIDNPYIVLYEIKDLKNNIFPNTNHFGNIFNSKSPDINLNDLLNDQKILYVVLPSLIKQ